MTNKEQLDRIVTQGITLHNAKFRQYWELYKQAAEIPDVEGLFVKIEEEARYSNVAVVGDGRLVDIEGDDSDDSGNLHIYSLGAVREVIIRLGSLPSLPSTKGATLLVVTRLAGQDGTGPYWVAKTPEQEEKLLSFAQCLVQAISTSKSI